MTTGIDVSVLREMSELIDMIGGDGGWSAKTSLEPDRRASTASSRAAGGAGKGRVGRRVNSRAEQGTADQDPLASAILIGNSSDIWLHCHGHSVQALEARTLSSFWDAAGQIHLGTKAP